MCCSDQRPNIEITKKYNVFFVYRVTILKDAQRRSRGVAFVQFLRIDDAHKCRQSVNDTEMFGRRLRASIATDNGRSAEFVRKRTYENKSRCYECGGTGGDHLSYQCPANVLGQREPPAKRKPKAKATNVNTATAVANNGIDDEEPGAITGPNASASSKAPQKKPKFKRSAYLSDDEDEVVSD